MTLLKMTRGLLAIIVGICGAADLAWAHVPDSTPPTAAPSPRQPLSTENVGAWFDGLIPEAMTHGDIAGAVVVVVKDGKVLFQRGYGYADIDARTAVNAETTLFRPGSISKTFTWTAVMQLVEVGKIDLDVDINTYLDFKIPSRDGKPITMRQLMTHSAGFADVLKDLIVGDPARLQSTESILKSQVPARIFPPGEIPAYSNYGASLAGYIVQRVSHEPFDAYVQRHIFTPLGMNHSTFEQPLPARFEDDMAKGYASASTGPGPYELVNFAPAGALASSGGDIARFMIAHLQDGAFNGHKILAPGTAKQMHSPQFRPVPGLGAMDLGFYEEPGNGRRVIGHAGDTERFHSDLHLYLDDNVGVFVSFNGGGASAHDIRAIILRGFTDRYIAPPPPQEPTWKNAKVDGQLLIGHYVITRRSESGWLRLTNYLIGQSTVTVDEQGVVTVSIFKGPNGKPRRWREIGPFIYREVNGDPRMAVALRGGKPFLIMTDDLPPVMGLMPVPPSMSAAWNLPLFYFSLSTLGVAALGWPVSALVRRHHGVRFELSGRTAILYRLTRLVTLIDLACVVSWAWFLTNAEHILTGPSDNGDNILRGLQVLGITGCIGALVTLVDLRQVLGDESSSWLAKFSSILISAAALSFCWFQFSLRLVSLKLVY
jgi:CubicO group peptidase (beta-lactamase class C family)